MSDDLTRRIEAILRAAAQEDHAGYWEVHVPSAARAIASLIAEERGRAFSEGQAVANGERRMCVNCGKTVPADRVKPGDELTECIGPYGMAACAFDATPQEAWEFWSKRWHELHQSLPTIRASARRAALEETAQFHNDLAAKIREMAGRETDQARRFDMMGVALRHDMDARAIRSLAVPEAE